MSAYETKDFPVICILRHLDFEFVLFSTEPEVSTEVTAYFDKTEKLEATCKSIQDRQLRFEPLAFLKTINEVRAYLDMVFNNNEPEDGYDNAE